MCKREQPLGTHRDSIQGVQTEYLRAAITAAWVLAVVTLGLAFGVTSIAGWVGLVLVAVVPPAVMLKLWHARVPSMSENIRDVLR